MAEIRLSKFFMNKEGVLCRKTHHDGGAPVTVVSSALPRRLGTSRRQAFVLHIKTTVLLLGKCIAQANDIRAERHCISFLSLPYKVSR